ncbi:hypothetical protein VNO80_02870 [Phaseolus coccineus]|uniref:Uncharacterized protein n=1 Tax=Phaseolus coccineus TaxID=3886 RepID=A0AAN9NQF5_PHACN
MDIPSTMVAFLKMQLFSVGEHTCVDFYEMVSSTDIDHESSKKIGKVDPPKKLTRSFHRNWRDTTKSQNLIPIPIVLSITTLRLRFHRPRHSNPKLKHISSAMVAFLKMQLFNVDEHTSLFHGVTTYFN